MLHTAERTIIESGLCKQVCAGAAGTFKTSPFTLQQLNAFLHRDGKNKIKCLSLCLDARKSAVVRCKCMWWGCVV